MGSCTCVKKDDKNFNEIEFSKLKDISKIKNH